MRSSTFLNTPARRAAKLRGAPPVVVTCAPEPEQRSRFAAFLLEVDAAREAASRDPVRAAKLLGVWVAADE